VPVQIDVPRETKDILMPATTKPLPPLVESIVHPTDFSASSERAFAHAVAIALLRRTTLMLLHVGSDPEWDKFPAVRRTLERWKLLERGSSQEQVFEQLGVRVAKLVIPGHSPAAAVVEYLDRHLVDLLVLATEGREGVARWLHGSVAEAMARRSRTMTLFVPADAKRDIVALADGNLTLKNVLIPVDALPDPAAALEFARRAAVFLGDDPVTITLLHVGTAFDVPLAHLEDGDRYRFRRALRDGDPVERILAEADAVEAELIVMPTEGRSGVFDMLRGSTTERVLRHAPCPLLAVPAQSAS
jgi:nucleotide-binding universal stress UspA family protein